MCVVNIGEVFVLRDDWERKYCLEAFCMNAPFSFSARQYEFVFPDYPPRPIIPGPGEWRAPGIQTVGFRGIIIPRDRNLPEGYALDSIRHALAELKDKGISYIAVAETNRENRSIGRKWGIFAHFRGWHVGEGVIDAFIDYLLSGVRRRDPDEPISIMQHLLCNPVSGVEFRTNFNYTYRNGPIYGRNEYSYYFDTIKRLIILSAIYPEGKIVPQSEEDEIAIARYTAWRMGAEPSIIR